MGTGAAASRWPLPHVPACWRGKSPFASAGCCCWPWCWLLVGRGMAILRQHRRSKHGSGGTAAVISPWWLVLLLLLLLLLLLVLLLCVMLLLLPPPRSHAWQAPEATTAVAPGGYAPGPWPIQQRRLLRLRRGRLRLLCLLLPKGAKGCALLQLLPLYLLLALLLLLLLQRGCRPLGEVFGHARQASKPVLTLHPPPLCTTAAAAAAATASAAAAAAAVVALAHQPQHVRQQLPG